MAKRTKSKRKAEVLARVPWEMSEERKPGEPVVSWKDRMPPEAARVGKILAGMSREGGLILALQKIAVPDRCKTCAFREGTVPNRCIDTVADAMKCVMEGRPFNCHVPRGGEIALDQMCSGWLRARAWAVAVKRDGRLFRKVTRAECEG